MRSLIAWASALANGACSDVALSGEGRRLARERARRVSRFPVPAIRLPRTGRRLRLFVARNGLDGSAGPRRSMADRASSLMFGRLSCAINFSIARMTALLAIVLNEQIFLVPTDFCE
ncbi:hypothetical protein ACFOD9_03985 [Novosphingobium bradum]|uniref:Secreted protein n=1 Tax=Novosphingobium bradum TaxID=1737444 RepID=A0ABV7IRH7_9SPHN